MSIGVHLAAEKILESGEKAVVVVDYGDGGIEELQSIVGPFGVSLRGVPWDRAAFLAFSDGEDSSPLRAAWALSVANGEKPRQSMADVQSRIEQEPACDVIHLTDAEKEIYSGAGWKLARFENGVLIEFLDPLDLSPSTGDADVDAIAAFSICMDWVNNAEGEVWMVLCSCFVLCEPFFVDPHDVEAMAEMGLCIKEQFEALR